MCDLGAQVQPAGISCMLVFGEGGKPENPEKNPRSREENQHKLNPLMASGPGIEPGPHWWEASALTTTPPLLPDINPGEVRGLIFGYVLLASQRPYPIIVYSVASYRLHLSHFWGICNFGDPNLVTVYNLILMINTEHFTFHLQYKHCVQYVC